jgi:hypothetical protein
MRFSRKIATITAFGFALTLAGAAAPGKTVREEELPPLPGGHPPASPPPKPNAPPAAKPDAPPAANPAPPFPAAKPNTPPASPAPPAAAGALGWGDAPAGTVAALAPRFPARPASPTLAELQRRLLLAAPAGGDGPRLAVLRAERLLAMGRAEDALAVLAGVPAVPGDGARLNIEVEATLVARGHAAACALVRRAMSARPPAPLERANVACLALAGDPARAAVALAALRSGRDAGDDALAALVEALDQGGDAPLPSLARADAWALAVAAASKRAWPADTARIAAPPLARLVAASRNDPASIRIAAAERAVAAGALPVEALGTLYVLPAFKAEERAAAASLKLSNYGPMGRALLYQAVRGAASAEARYAVLAHWSRLARAEGDLALAGRAAGLLLRGAAPDPAARRHAAEIARLLFQNGDLAGGLAWVDMLRQAQFKDIDAYRRVAALALLAGAAENGFAESDRAAWRAEIGRGAGGERRIAVYEALAAALARGGARPAVRGEALARLLASFGEGGLAKAAPAALGEAVATLAALGLPAEARRLALEAALAAGL